MSIDEYEEGKEITSTLFFHKYHCIEKISQGSFGIIYKAEYNKKYYAMKFERNDNKYNTLNNEAKVLKNIQGPNIPNIIKYGYSGKYNIIVMELLGENLEQIISKYKKFSIKTTCILLIQMITILEYIHSKNIIHRDIKPENFAMGIDINEKYVYLLDFGLAKKFYSYSRKINTKKLTGTANYASINSLKGFEQSRRDDLESLSYVIMYLLKGNLPWINIDALDKYDRYKKILKEKMEINISEFCKNLPIEFEYFFNYCRLLKFEEIPNYEKLKQLFYDVLIKENFQMDYIYDWSSLNKLTINNKKKLSLINDNNNDDINYYLKENHKNNEYFKSNYILNTNEGEYDLNNMGNDDILLKNYKSKKGNEKIVCRCFIF